MRVLGIAFFASAGGDFHPLVAAAAGLGARGHHVQLFCDPEGARLVVETGIGTVVDEEGWAAAARVDDELRPQVQHAAPEERARLVAEWLARRTNTLLPACVQAVKQARPDVLVSATLTAPLARDAAGDTGTAWCVVNSTYDMARAPETPAAEWLAPALRAAPPSCTRRTQSSTTGSRFPDASTWDRSFGSRAHRFRPICSRKGLLGRSSA